MSLWDYFKKSPLDTGILIDESELLSKRVGDSILREYEIKLARQFMSEKNPVSIYEARNSILLDDYCKDNCSSNEVVLPSTTLNVKSDRTIVTRHYDVNGDLTEEKVIDFGSETNIDEFYSDNAVSLNKTLSKIKNDQVYE